MLPSFAVRRRSAFMGPLVGWVLVLTVVPLAWSLALAFSRLDPAGGISFVGLANFRGLLGDYRFWGSFRVTVAFAAAATAVELLLGLALAVLVYEAGSAAARWRAPFAVPFFMAPVALGYLGLTVFHEESGPLNMALRAAGLEGVPWLSSPGGAFFSLLLTDVWEWTPFCFLIAYAGLLAMPADLLEAARLEPLSAWSRFRYLTFPLVRPSLALAGLLRLVEALKTTDLPFSLTGGGPGAATETLGLLAYRKCMKFLDFGYGSALAYVLFALVLVICQVLARWHLRSARD